MKIDEKVRDELLKLLAGRPQRHLMVLLARWAQPDLPAKEIGVALGFKEKTAAAQVTRLLREPVMQQAAEILAQAALAQAVDKRAQWEEDLRAGIKRFAKAVNVEMVDLGDGELVKQFSLVDDDSKPMCEPKAWCSAMDMLAKSLGFYLPDKDTSRRRFVFEAHY